MSPALNQSPDIYALTAGDECPDISSRGERAAREVAALSSHLTIPIAEVSSALGLTTRQLMRKHRSLTTKNGFPPPLPGGIWMWSRAAFEAWVRANGVQSVELDADEPMATAANDPTAALVREQNASLRMRYGGAR